MSAEPAIAYTEDPTNDVLACLGLPASVHGVIFRVQRERSLQMNVARRLSAAIEGAVLEISSITVMPDGEIRVGIRKTKQVEMTIEK